MKHVLASCIFSSIFTLLPIGAGAAPSEESGPFSVVVAPAAPGKPNASRRHHPLHRAQISNCPPSPKMKYRSYAAAVMQA